MFLPLHFGNINISYSQFFELIEQTSEIKMLQTNNNHKILFQHSIRSELHDNGYNEKNYASITTSMEKNFGIRNVEVKKIPQCKIKQPVY